MTHCMVVDVSRETFRTYGILEVLPRLRKQLAWAMLMEGKQAVTAAGVEGHVVWIGLTFW